MNRFWPLVFSFWFLFSVFAWAGDNGFTSEDRNRLIRLESTMKVFMDQTDKRFEDMNKRFEDMNKRFEDMNKRFEDMNKRFEELRTDTNKRFEELRTDTNKRFEELRTDMNKRFEQLYTFLWIISGIFAGLVVAVIGFAYWDRRTILSRAKEESVKEVDRVYDISQFKKLLSAIRSLSEKNAELAQILKSFGLL